MRYIFQGRIRDNFGNVVDETPIKVYEAGTSRVVKVYENETGGSPIETLPQVLSDSNGFFELWVDDADYSFTQFFDVVVNSIRYKKIDIMNRETAIEVGYTPENFDYWAGDGNPATPTDVKEALDELAVHIETNKIQMIDGPLSSQILTGAAISAGTNAGTIKVGSGTILLRNSTGATDPLTYLSIAETDNITITDADKIYYVVCEYNLGTPHYVVQEPEPNNTTNINIGRCLREVDNTIHFRNTGLRLSNGLAKGNDRARHLREWEMCRHIVIGDNEDKTFTISSGHFFRGFNKIPHSGFDSGNGDTFTYVKNVDGTWTYVVAQTEIDVDNYNDVTDAVDGLKTCNRYKCDWIFVHPDTGHTYVVYGQDNDKLGNIEDTTVPLLPDLVDRFGMLICRIIIDGGVTVFHRIEMINGNQFIPSPVIDHNDNSNIQGGTTDEYYHLTSAEYTIATQVAVLVNTDTDVNAHTEWQDSKEARFGDDADLKLYHNGTHSYIDNVTGNLYLRVNTTENALIASPNGAVELYYNNVKRFETTNTGIQITGLEVSGNTLINGNLTVSGSEFITHSEHVSAADNLITINAGASGSGVAKGYAGIEVDRGLAPAYRFIFDETDDNFQIGEVGSLQVVATREDTPQANGIPFWNSGGGGEFRFDTSPGLTYTGNQLTLSAGTGIDEFSIDGTLTGNSDDAVPTEKAVKTYVDSANLALLVDGVAGRVLRTSHLYFKDGTQASKLKMQLTDNWNGDILAETDNIGKGETVNNFTWSADGTKLTVEAAGLSGNVLGAFGLIWKNALGDVGRSHLTILAVAEPANDFTVEFYEQGSGISLDIGVLIDLGNIYCTIIYITDA